MKREVYGPIGLLMVLMGVTAIAAMNLWLVPEIVGDQRAQHAKGGPEGLGTAPRPLATPTVKASVTQAVPDAPLADAATDSASKDSEVDAPLDVADASDASDAAKFGATVMRFDAGKTILSRDQVPQIEAVAAQLRNNFGLKIILTGHGDEPSVPAEYNKVGRSRAVVVMRALIDYGVSAARIAFENPGLDGGIAEGASGSVELKLVPRFAEGGEKHVP